MAGGDPPARQGGTATAAAATRQPGAVRTAAGAAAAHSAANHAAADRASRDAALVLGLTLPGDTVLYLLLPLHAAVFGVSLAEAGLLLAANRLVRILGYGWVARFYTRRGPRASCLLAVLGATAAAAGYALSHGVWWLLVARLLWGLSFAAMNIATQATATALAEGAARRSGTSRAIISTGPMLGLLAGAVLAEFQGPRLVFAVLAAVSLLALPFAWRLPAGPGEALHTPGPRFGLPARLDVWSFVQGMALDGVFVLGLSVLAAAALPQGAALAAGAALASRYASEILLAPPAGRLAERFGALPVLIAVSIVSAAGIALIGLGALWIGAVAVVGLRGLLQPLPAPVAAAANPGPARVPALARMSTWRDMGAGLGPLVAGTLLPLVPPVLLYGGTALALALTSLALLPRFRSPLRR
ncbi:MAG: MFS transporter [Acetobacteraceae bacterium]|nr:MFS transporter [Acetobacteraceae bacterium]